MINWGRVVRKVRGKIFGLYSLCNGGYSADSYRAKRINKEYRTDARCVTYFPESNYKYSIEALNEELGRYGYSVEKFGATMCVFNIDNVKVSDRYHMIRPLDEFDEFEAYIAKLGASWYLLDSEFNELSSGHHNLFVNSNGEWFGQTANRKERIVVESS